MTSRGDYTRQVIDTLQIKTTLALPIAIRAARFDDIAKLEWFGAFSHFRELYQRTWQDHLAGLRLILVADLRGFPVGQVWLDVTPVDYAYLYAFRVLEPLRGAGIGTMLMRAAEQIAAKHGYHQIQLAVEKVNRAARRLYEREGYQTFTQRVDVWSYNDEHHQVHWVQEDVYGMRKYL